MATKKAVKPVVADIRAQVLTRITEGESLRSICSDKAMPVISTVMKWVSEDELFSEQYARAREAQADLIFEDLDEVSEQATVASNAVEVAGLRLKADNIKWKLARMSPRKYGEKVTSEITGPNGGPVETSLKVSFV